MWTQSPKVLVGEQESPHRYVSNSELVRRTHLPTAECSYSQTGCRTDGKPGWWSTLMWRKYHCCRSEVRSGAQPSPLCREVSAHWTAAETGPWVCKRWLRQQLLYPSSWLCYKGWGREANPWPLAWWGWCHKVHWLFLCCFHLSIPSLHIHHQTFWY